LSVSPVLNFLPDRSYIMLVLQRLFKNNETNKVSFLASHYCDIYTNRRLEELLRESRQEDIFAPRNLFFKGVPKVFVPKTSLYDNRFHDLSNTWHVYDNEPLKDSLEKFAKSPVATSFEKRRTKTLASCCRHTRGCCSSFR
jgi:hypothetical protein